MQIKIGDRVQHREYKDVSGFVTAIRPCDHDGCDKESLTLDETKFRSYYHSDSFS